MSPKNYGPMYVNSAVIFLYACFMRVVCVCPRAVCVIFGCRGHRYELAYHDWTQIKICGCTRFNMTRTDTKIKDAFTTKCPYEADIGETFLINMRETVDFATPGSFREFAFYNKWDNKVRAGLARLLIEAPPLFCCCYEC